MHPFACKSWIIGFRPVLICILSLPLSLSISKVSRVHDGASAVYHKRADDSLIYFDCGSYAQGPVQVTNDMEGKLLPTRGSLSFPTVPKSRVVFGSSANDWQNRAQVRLRRISMDYTAFEKKERFGSCQNVGMRIGGR